MEKIYMEENDNQQQGKSVINFSVILSFVVSIFAIFSIAAFGILTNQESSISYAAPLGEMPSSFTFADVKDTSDNILRIKTSIAGNQAAGAFNVPLYSTDSGTALPILCLEHNSDTREGATYYQDGEISDQGLLYILSNTYLNGVTVTDATGDDAKYVENWVAQVAVWVYQYDVHGGASEDSRHYIDANSLNVIKNANVLELLVGTDVDLTRVIYTSSSGSIYDRFVSNIVENAKNESAKKSLTVTRANGDVAKTSDGKYYQTTLVTVTPYPAGAMTSYDVSFTGVEGAFAVDGDGNKLGPTNIPAGTNFYVRVPVEKVTENLSKLKISVTGHFNSLTGYYYAAKDGEGNYVISTGDGKRLQQVGSLTQSARDITAGEEYEVVGSPNTGMSTAQTIYFIGLIILLCGIGIVYANAKPVESKQ